jgi:pimeloyl-ACP methyl ester carboxylesterase
LHIKTGVKGGVQWVRAHGFRPRGIVFVPPLIGGHALQQIHALRRLAHRRLDVISFCYAGHGESSGVFSFQASLDNCSAVLDWARGQSLQERLPLYGIASCFGALPMIHSAAQRHEPLARMVLVNAVPHWRWENVAIHFVRRWFFQTRGWLSIAGIRMAMDEYLQDLFPRVVHRSRSFGILSRRRMRWLKMTAELWAFRHRPTVPLHNTPVLCAYGRRDRLLRQMGFVNWSGYETDILNVCPQARFWQLDGDHFLSRPAVRYRLLDTVAHFLTDR